MANLLGGIPFPKDPERLEELTRKSVNRFRRMQPTLTSYARALTGKRVRVEMHALSNGMTDGDRIMIRPPLALGLDLEHSRSLCDVRDAKTLSQLCLACRQREEVLAVIHHEISHIAFGSFFEVTEYARNEFLQRVLDTHPSNPREVKRIQAAVSSAPYAVRTSWMGLSNIVSEYFGMLVNAIEDARVNLEMYRARRGTKPMMDAIGLKAFCHGVEQKDASGNMTVIQWRDYPLNAQMMVAVYASASELSGSFFHPVVEEALRDAKLQKLIQSCKTLRSAEGAVKLAFEILMRLRELGFMTLPPDPDEEEPNPDKGDSDAEETSEDRGDSSGASDADEESSAPSDADRDESEDSPDGGSGLPGDDSTEPEVSDSPRGDESGDDERPGATGDSSVDLESGGSSESADVGARDSDGDESGAGDRDADTGHEGDAGEPSTGDGAGTAPGSDGNGASDRDDLDGDADSDDESVDGVPSAGVGGGAGPGSSGSGTIKSDSNDGGMTDGEEDPGRSDPRADGERSGDADADHDDRGDRGDVEGSTDAEAGGDADADGPESLEGSRAPLPAESGGDTGTTYDPTGSVTKEYVEDGDLLDTGVFDRAPIKVIEEGSESDSEGDSEELPVPEFGTVDDARVAVLKVSNHDILPDEVMTASQEKQLESATEIAIVQSIYFAQPSREVSGIEFGKWVGDRWTLWGRDVSWGTWGHERGADIKTAESILGPALLRMRRAFSDNARGGATRNMRSGDVDGRVLGRRAWQGDNRLFLKKRAIKKKSHFVLIGIDISGSTAGVNIVLAKRAALAQAELCHRLGVDFAIYAHSGDSRGGWGSRDMSLIIFEIKGPRDPWDAKVRQKFDEICSYSANLDGHTLEHYRWRLDQLGKKYTDYILMYYTDGAMPCENYAEELDILRREIQTCSKRGYHLVGVGIRTDAPKAHGLDTVRVEAIEDITKVVTHLEKRLREG